MKKMLLLAALAAACILAHGAFNALAGEKEMDKLPETKVKIDNVPEKVRAAIIEAVGDGRLVDIGVFTQDDGSKIYEIEMVVAGKEYDVLFDDSGKVLRKTFEGEKPAGKANKKAGAATET
ncbi:MAG: PepSY domain-containing protein, partial [Planctomycetota bacterium]